ncbi:MAG TPA: GAF domain-containing protein [Frankiaceae bacterium]|nr:GAF domain-containing protein [Frankiaceae bacterium]
MPLGRYGTRPDPRRGGGVAENRVRFLTDEPVNPGGVRDAILASWSRSRRYEVAADRIELPYIRDPDIDIPLARSAEPVLRSLAEQLDGQPISIVLTDASGLVLSRLTADAELERHLDRVRLAPGFSYAEEFVGTNGIGTALEGGRPMHVFGHEHYAERLEDLACAGVPICHPISGVTVGALDLTCWRKDAGPLLGTLAKTTTEQIRQALLADTSMREIELLQEYLRTCHRSSGAVFALNNNVVMINDYARAVLAPADQDVLLRQAADSSFATRRTSLVDLPSGQRARLSTRPVNGRDGVVGLLGQVRLVDVSALGNEGGGSASHMLLPGLIGAGASWRRACDESEVVCADDVWLAVEGEPGVGKHSLLRAVHHRRRATRRLVDVDLAVASGPHWMDDITSALDGDGTLLLRHVDRLDGVRLRTLTAVLQRTRAVERPRSAWVAITVGTTTKSPELLRLLDTFPRSVQVPPLRHHAEDVPRLVDFFLARLGYSGRLACSLEVQQVLARNTWPGNAEQLLQVLRTVLKQRRSGVIGVDDLPPEILTVSRRTLSPIEAIERDAIVRSLLDARDNKAEAARALGMSRATIYRKVHEYGILQHNASSPAAQQKVTRRSGAPHRRESTA